MNFVKFTSAACVAVLLAASAGAYSDEAVKDAEEFLKYVKDRHAVGEVTRTDVAQAEYHLLEMQYRAGLISARTYCGQALPVLETRGKGIADEMKVGQRTTQDMVDHKREFYKFKEACEQPAPRPKRRRAPAHPLPASGLPAS